MKTIGEKLLNKYRSLPNQGIGFFIFAVLLFWLKTYVTYLAEFNLGISNSMQEFLLFINPLSSAVFFLGLAFLAKLTLNIKMAEEKMTPFFETTGPHLREREPFRKNDDR